MMNSRVDGIALVAAMIAAGLGLMLLTGQLAWLSSIAGIVLLLIIFAYDREGYRSGFQSLAFSVVCGFCLVLAAEAGLRFWAVHSESSGPNAQLAVESLTVLWLPLIWACASVIFLAIDRARMKNRRAPSIEYGREPEPARRPRGMLDIGGDTGVIRPTDLATNERPIAPQPAPAVVSVAHAAPEPVPQSTPAPMPQPAPVPQSAPPGKEVMVYVGLVGEGLNVMRSVRAEHVGRNFYRIVESMPEGETWEYGPGQVVRCEKKKLSSGKALVAVEEAPRKA